MKGFLKYGADLPGEELFCGRCSEKTSISNDLRSVKTLPEEDPAESSSVYAVKNRKRNLVIPAAICSAVIMAAAGMAACSAAPEPSNSRIPAIESTESQENEAATHYANAVLESQNGHPDKAIEEFRLAGDYKDAKKLLAGICITQGDKEAGEGNYDRALEYYKIAGEYQDVSDKTTSVTYARGVAARKNGKYKEAAEFFGKAGEYKDSAEQLKMCYYSLAEDEVAQGKTGNAASYYRKAGDYKDAPEKAKQYSYEDGIYFFKKGDYLSAASNFEYAGDYKDAAERVKISYYHLGMECLNKKDYEHAEDYLEYAGNYKDAAAKLKEANYYLGLDAMKSDLTDYAAEYFQAAGNFKNAKKLLAEISYKAGLENLNNKNFEDAKTYFAKCGKYKLAQDFVRVCNAEIFCKDNNLSEAAKQYKLVSAKAKTEAFDIQARKKEVTLEAAFAAVDGDWTAKSNNTYVNKTKKTKRYKKSKTWRLTTLASGQYLEITYYKNENGNFDFTVKACFLRFLNFSTFKANVDTGYYEVEKTIENAKKFPTSIQLDKNTTLKYSKGTYTLSYSRKTGHGWEPTRFRSTVKFKKVK